MRYRLRLDTLREIVARSTISQNHWAIRLGLSRGHWSDLLAGKHPYPSSRTRTRLVEVLGEPEEVLFAAESEDAPPDESQVRRALSARYEFLQELGRGATGVVLAALDRRLGRTVAIKVVQAEAVAGVGTEQLLAELGHAAKLTHPNILPLHDAGVEHGHPYVVMPLVRGGSLRGLLEREVRLSVTEVLTILEGVGRGLAFAHSRQLLHCDVKPENILVEDGHAYLTDFGIARRLDTEADEWASLRGTLGYSAGTPAYVSPEQASGEPIDHRSDVYSLACVAYEMLAGRLPFTGRNTQEIVAKRFHAAPPPLRDTAPDVPQRVADVIARAMDVSPNRRPDTAIAFVRELRAAAAPGSRAASAVAVGATRFISRVSSRLGMAGPARLRLPLSDMLDDFRYAFRALRRDWRFSFNTIVSLGLGLGVGLPAISLADHIFLRPPPGIKDPYRVVRLVKRWDTNGQLIHGTSMTGLDLLVQSEARSLDGVAAAFVLGSLRGRGPDAVPIRTMQVTGNFFTLLGARMALGRGITPEEDRDGATEGPAVLGYRYWQREFEGAPSAIGRVLDIGTRRYTVVGVAAEGFNGLELNEIEIFLPLHVAGRDVQGPSPTLFTGDGSAWINIIARLADGVGIEAAETESNTLYRRPGTYVRDRERTNVLLWESIVPGRTNQARPDLRLALWVSVGSVLLLALIAANLVNLFVARSAARARQTAIRVALGGRTVQLLRLQLAEALLLGLGGTMLGLLISTPVTGVARALIIPNVVWSRETVDPRVIAIAFALSLGAGAIAAFAALLHSRRVEPAELLRSAGGARGGVGRGARLVRSTMLVIQAGAFVVMLSMSAAFTASVQRATRVEHGFVSDNLLFVEFPQLELEGDARRRKLAEVAEAIAAEPGVAGVSQGYMVPWWNNADEVALGIGRTEPMRVWFDNATPSHLATLGMRMRGGRWFEASDQTGTEPVAVVNETFIRAVWPEGGALGRCVRLRADSLPCHTIVGVVHDTRFFGRIDDPVAPVVHLPYAQSAPFGRAGLVFVRLRDARMVTDEQLRAVIRRLDPTVPRASIRRMPEHLSWMTRPYEVGRATFTVFGALAGVIALIGLTGVLSYLVTQDRAAYAVRIALGAPSARVVRPVLWRAMTLVGLGSGVGFLLMVPWRERIDSLLYHTTVFSPSVVALVTAVALGVAALAAWIPMRAVLRIQPMEVLREE